MNSDSERQGHVSKWSESIIFFCGFWHESKAYLEIHQKKRKAYLEKADPLFRQTSTFN